MKLPFFYFFLIEAISNPSINKNKNKFPLKKSKNTPTIKTFGFRNTLIKEFMVHYCHGRIICGQNLMGLSIINK